MPRRQSGDSSTKSNKGRKASTTTTPTPAEGGGGLGAVFAAAIPTQQVDISPAAGAAGDSFAADFPTFEEGPAPPKGAAPPRKGSARTAPPPRPTNVPTMATSNDDAMTPSNATPKKSPHSEGGEMAPPSTVRSEDDGVDDAAKQQNGTSYAGSNMAVEIERSDARQKMADERSRFESEREEAMQALSAQEDAYNKDKSSFDTDRSRIVDHSMANESMVALNVGGTTFETSRQTLCQQEGSFLEAILSGRYEVPKDADGRVFLDRDPEMFRQILNFLRNPMNPPCPRDATESMLLAREADFYGVEKWPGYDVRANKWMQAQGCDLIEERSAAAAVNYLGNIFAFGGIDNEQNIHFTVESLRVSEITKGWSFRAQPAINRMDCAAATYGESILVGGGQNGEVQTSVETYDPVSDTWMPAPPMLFPRYGHQYAVVNL
ncbi:BTB/POZ domain-containing protein kctd3 [Perkinsus olseni]|uniref:BTB/POZ domain-containing protein kctd3 n=1 Tax=Perkinsus olseni TaxID=32597 RepID=A0A7J6LAQ7_PEROL|nr:BTB/POZ domain-containing protein kctd3 [Perkinsus olseni]